MHLFEMFGLTRRTDTKSTAGDAELSEGDFEGEFEKIAAPSQQEDPPQIPADPEGTTAPALAGKEVGAELLGAAVPPAQSPLPDPAPKSMSTRAKTDQASTFPWSVAPPESVKPEGQMPAKTPPVLFQTPMRAVPSVAPISDPIEAQIKPGTASGPSAAVISATHIHGLEQAKTGAQPSLETKPPVSSAPIFAKATTPENVVSKLVSPTSKPSEIASEVLQNSTSQARISGEAMARGQQPVQAQNTIAPKTTNQLSANQGAPVSEARPASPEKVAPPVTRAAKAEPVQFAKAPDLAAERQLIDSKHMDARPYAPQGEARVTQAPTVQLATVRNQGSNLSQPIIQPGTDASSGAILSVQPDDMPQIGANAQASPGQVQSSFASQPISQVAAPPASVPQQVAAQLAVQITADKRGEVEMTLDPAELGQVRIQFHSRDAGTIISLFAERPETMELLRRHADELLDRLAENDVQNATLQFENQQSGAEQHPDTEEGPFDTHMSAELQTADANNAPSGPGLSKGADGHLDIRL